MNNWVLIIPVNQQIFRFAAFPEGCSYRARGENFPGSVGRHAGRHSGRRLIPRDDRLHWPLALPACYHKAISDTLALPLGVQVP